MEALDRVELLAGTDKLDRLAGDRTHRQRRTATRIAVHAGQHDTGQRHLVREALRDIDRVLAGEAVDHQQHFCGARDTGDGLHLGHQRFIDMQAARRIEQQHVGILQFRALKRAPCDIDRLLAGHDRQRGDTGLLAEHGELFLRRRTVDVERGHQRLLALLVLEQLGDLGSAGGLARPLQADHHHHGGRADIEVERDTFAAGILAAEHRDQFVIDDLDDLLARLDRFEDRRAHCLFGDAVDEVARNGQRHVGFEQRDAHLAHGAAHVLLA